MKEIVFVAGPCRVLCNLCPSAHLRLVLTQRGTNTSIIVKDDPEKWLSHRLQAHTLDLSGVTV